MLKWLKNAVLRGILVKRMCTNGIIYVAKSIS